MNQIVTSGQQLASERIRQVFTSGGSLTPQTLRTIAEDTGLTDGEVRGIAAKLHGVASVAPRPSGQEREKAESISARTSGGALTPTQPAAAYQPPAWVEKIAVDENYPAATRNKAKRAIELISAVAQDISLHSERAKDLERLKKLEAEAAQLRARLRGGKSTTERTMKYGEYPCDVCGKVCTTKAGLFSHQRNSNHA